MIENCNVTMTDETSGIIGLGFPRLSSIDTSVTNCACLYIYYPNFLQPYQTATPFFVTLAQQGLLEYPVFGLSLTRNASGTLSIGT
jgi:hypothetical protein